MLSLKTFWENNMSNKEVANTILKQLGGHRFIAMTGANSFFSENNALLFKIPRTKKVKAVKVMLDADDTYTVRFIGQKNAPSFEVFDVAVVAGVYCDQLQEIFTENTGLYTSL